MSDEAEIAQVILAALLNANINFPEMADGTTRVALYRNTEESEHLGRAVLAALKQAGYVITKADEKAQQTLGAALPRD